MGRVAGPPVIPCGIVQRGWLGRLALAVVRWKVRLAFGTEGEIEGKVRRMYGVLNTFGIFRGRVTYVIDEAGVVRHVFSSQIEAVKHVEGALKSLAAIRS